MVSLLHAMRPQQKELHHGLFAGINPVIRFMTMSDVVILGAMQLLAPVFALFIVEKIDGANAAVVGASAAVYLITKSIGQVPAATLLDRVRGEKDDYVVLSLGTFVFGVIPLLYLVINTPMELYVVQFLLGLSAAITYPAYMAVFTRHIDRRREATEWGIRFTLIDLAAAISASLGGLIAVMAGFETLIIGLVVLSTLGACLILPIRSHLRSR